MAKLKICLAVSDQVAESFLQEKILEKDSMAVFTPPALHREAVIDRVSFDMPSILIISENLNAGGNSISFDAVITTIRTKYEGCRIIILAGNHEVGDAFLNKMVSRGVYDIIFGSNVNLNDIVDCVFHPKDYSYAEKLQGLEVTPQSEEVGKSVNMVNVVEEEREKRSLFRNRNNSDPGYQNPLGASQNPNTLENQNTRPENSKPEAPEPDYGTTILKVPSPKIESDEKVIDYDTTILTNNEPVGIIFERVGPAQPQMDSEFQNIPNHPEQQYDSSYSQQQGYQNYNAAPQNPSQKGQSFNNRNGRSVSSHPVASSRVLTNSDKNFGNNPLVAANHYLPKIILFMGARQGVGCTTAVINTAFSMAYKGKRVAVIDAVWNEKAIFDRLSLKHEDLGFNNTQNKPLPNGFVSSFATEVSNKEGKGFIQFLELMTAETMPDGILTTIRALSSYNYILIDMSIAYYNPFIAGLIKLSDAKVAVVTQDSYEFMVLKNYLTAFGNDRDIEIFKNLSLLINKGEPKAYPDMKAASDYFGLRNNIFMIPCDNAGFINASVRHAQHGVYVYSGKRKIIKLYSIFADMLQ